MGLVCRVNTNWNFLGNDIKINYIQYISYCYHNMYVCVYVCMYVFIWTQMGTFQVMTYKSITLKYIPYCYHN
ncbi:MAG: hypothetical protein NW900_02385, partial [Candidatus Blochmannia sp. A2]|nr:hypothetical protein [Candidatus Blochmannia sp. A2]